MGYGTNPFQKTLKPSLTSRKHDKTKKALSKKPNKKKFKILAAGDFHGDSKATKKLAEKAEKENVDLVVLTGDITGLVETDNIIKPFIEKGKRKM